MTILTDVRDLLTSAGWSFYRAGELISPDQEWVLKTGYANFESYVQLLTPSHGMVPATVIEHLRLRGPEANILAIRHWLAGHSIQL